MIRRIGGEISFDQIRRRSGVLVPDRCFEAFAPTGTGDLPLAHQARYALITHAKTLIVQVRLKARSTVRSPRLTMQCLKAIAKQQVALVVLRGRAMHPRIVAARRDFEHSAQHGNGIFGVIRLHEFERLSGIELVSRANHAAAFDSISFSIVNRLLSRRRRESSTRSSVVKPSAR